MEVSQLQDKCHKTAVEHGWWENERPIGELLALIHSEVSEALEEYRSGKGLISIRQENGKPEGFFVELADVVIRVADLFGRYDLSMEDVLKMKMTYNDSRPYRHGGKIA